MKRISLAVALALLGLTAAGHAQHKQDRLPGDARWELGAWANDYVVTATAYDAHTHQVTWTLEARKRVAARHYRAVFFDPDQLEMANVTIHFEPARSEYLKGSRVKATLKVPAKDLLQEVNRVRIDDAGPVPAK